MCPDTGTGMAGTGMADKWRMGHKAMAGDEKQWICQAE